jgi:hypothetical protein
MIYLDHRDQVVAAALVVLMAASVEWIAERLIAYAQFMWRIVSAVAGFFFGG